MRNSLRTLRFDEFRLTQSLYEADDKDTGKDEPDERNRKTAYWRADTAVRHVGEARQSHFAT